MNISCLGRIASASSNQTREHFELIFDGHFFSEIKYYHPDWIMIQGKQQQQTDIHGEILW